MTEEELDDYLSRSTCDVVTDDGRPCLRTWHSEDPDAHDFVGQSQTPVDGGRNWRDWIAAVNQVRSLLLPQMKEGDVGREGRLAEWHPDYCRAMLADVAEAVGLKIERDQTGLVPLKITEA